MFPLIQIDEFALSQNFSLSATPVKEAVSQLTKLQLLLLCHSGLDPESSAFAGCQDSGCRIRSGMTSSGFRLYRQVLFTHSLSLMKVVLHI